MHVTPQRAFTFIKLSLVLLCSWPPSPTASRRERLFFHVFWCISFANTISFISSLCYAIYAYRSESVILGNSVCFCSAVIQVAIKMIVCRLQRGRFQNLLHEMEKFCKRANPTERMVLQRYVDKYKFVYASFVFWAHFTAFCVICGPLYLPQMFPTFAKYPFSVESQPLKTIIYLHQSWGGFQASSGVAIDCQIALLLFYASARFDILGMELSKVSSERELDACIRRHGELLRYTSKINLAVRFLILTTILVNIIGVVFGGLNLISDEPAIVKILFMVVVFSACTELFMCAWPANHLIQRSMNTSLAAYSSNWYEKNVSVQRKIFFLILRSQKPETIRIKGFLERLSLPYYAYYLYSSFSYFTALRVMMAKNGFN